MPIVRLACLYGTITFVYIINKCSPIIHSKLSLNRIGISIIGSSLSSVDVTGGTTPLGCRPSHLDGVVSYLLADFLIQAPDPIHDNLRLATWNSEEPNYYTFIPFIGRTHNIELWSLRGIAYTATAAGITDHIWTIARL